MSNSPFSAKSDPVHEVTQTHANAPTDNALDASATVASIDSTATFDQLPMSVQIELDELREDAELSRQAIAELKETVDTLSQSIDTQLAQSSEPATTQTTEISPPATTTPEERERLALLESGVDSDTVARIQRLRDSQALARLELLDQASRENWDETRRQEELDRLRDNAVDLQAELGDAAYDQFLFNSGRSNRVTIASIIEGSTASVNGLEVGDLVVRYANQSVYTMRALRQLTREGTRNETVLVEVDRDGQRLTFNVERGPLGITMDSFRQAASEL